MSMNRPQPRHREPVAYLSATVKVGPFFDQFNTVETYAQAIRQGLERGVIQVVDKRNQQ